MSLIEVNWNPGLGRLRLFAGLLPVFAGLLAWLIHAKLGATAPAAGLVAAGLLVSLVGLIRPAWFRPVYLVWMALGLPVSWMLSHGILLVLYFGVLTPLAVVMRCGGYDPLRRRVDPRAETYWTPHVPVDDHRRYFRQY